MSLTCQDVINIVETLAPRYLAVDGDNVGLQIGDRTKPVKKVLVALDAVAPVVKEAIDNEVDMIVTHHPFFYRPAKNISYDMPQGRIIRDLIVNGITLYSAHTNLDAAIGGVNDVLCNILGIRNADILEKGYAERLKKLVVYVPEGYLDNVRDAMCKAGAGFIGNYSDCTFSAEGTGTFLPREGTNPFIGERGKLERVKEYRLETIVPEGILGNVIDAMLSVHPYEEVAYDIYPVEENYRTYGLGRIGILDESMSLSQFARYVKEKLSLPFLRVVGDEKKVIKKVALCGGNGTNLINTARAKGADVMLTGDVGYHQAQDAKAAGIAIVDAGHCGTEKIIVPALVKYIKDGLKDNDIDVMASNINIEPFHVV